MFLAFTWCEVLMKLAITTFGSRVAPRFDCADEMLVVEYEGDRRAREVRIALPGPEADQHVRQIVDRRIGVLICGGITPRAARQLELSGVQVLAWVSGETTDAVAAFERGELEPRMMMGPGGRCCGRWGVGQGRGRGMGRGGSQGRGRGMGQGGGQGRGRGRGRGRGMGPGGGQGRGRGGGMGQGGGQSRGRMAGQGPGTSRRQGRGRDPDRLPDESQN